METIARKPYQGVTNIIRFNWHFYLIAGTLASSFLFISYFVGGASFWAFIVLATGLVLTTTISLFVSHYIYDRSGLYRFDWVERIGNGSVHDIVNVHAGFDETTSILKNIFPASTIHVLDFYDPSKHTEISIERARKAYRPPAGTIRTGTDALPLAEDSADLIFNIFALHEIRNTDERIEFMRAQVRTLRAGGKIMVVEHLRDLPNLLVYNIGFFHFFPLREWMLTFHHAGLCIHEKFQITPFITIFILQKANGDTR